LTGVVERVEAGAVVVGSADGSVARRVLVAANDVVKLEGMVGRSVTLHTIEQFEASGQGGHLTPRMLGFLEEGDRRFFELLTGVKGIGPRKALRAMAAPVDEIAGAIAGRDTKWLGRLPEIGKRTAEAMVAELHDRVGSFAVEVEIGEGGDGGVEVKSLGGAAEQAIGALVQLGETRSDAEMLVRRALEREPGLDSADGLLAAAFSVRS